MAKEIISATIEKQTAEDVRGLAKIEKRSFRMIERINQSFVKDFESFLYESECGVIITEKYVNGRYLSNPNDDPGAKELGIYFEWAAFGTMPKNGVMPVPVYNKDGKMASEYRLATINAKRVNKLITVDYGLEIIKSGWTVVKGRYSGTIDLACRCTKEIKFDNGIVWHVGDVVIIDVKYSGLLKETTPGWNKHGWKFSEIQKAYHGIQATHYHFLTDAPFYYLVCQSNNPEGTLSDIKFFNIPVTTAMIEKHLDKANTYFEKFQRLAISGGLIPRPSFGKCQKCPLLEECKYAHHFPHPVMIDVAA